MVNAISTGELTLYGMIGADDDIVALFDGDAQRISPKRIKQQLESLGNVSELTVYLNSDGGDLFAGQAIHSMLKRHKAHKTVYIDGLAASNASIVAMAGDKVVMPRNAMMMIHNPWTMAMGDARHFRDMADTLDHVRESMVAVYQDKTGIDRTRLLSMLNAETWMTAEEAYELGFATEIDSARQVAASVRGDKAVINGQEFDLGRFQKTPSHLVVQRASQAVQHITPAALSRDTAATPESGNYSHHADSVLASVRELAQRTRARHVSRARVKRTLSDADVERWQIISAEADAMLGLVVPPGETDVATGKGATLQKRQPNPITASDLPTWDIKHTVPRPDQGTANDMADMDHELHKIAALLRLKRVPEQAEGATANGHYNPLSG